MTDTYDKTFTALTYAEFQRSAEPLVEDYKNAMGRKDENGKTKTYDIETARNALFAHCRAWAITKKRKELVDDFIVAACYN